MWRAFGGTGVAFLAALAATLAAPPATAKTELTIYTAYENDDLKPYKAAFEKDNPDIVVNWVRDSTGVVTAKILAERENPRADAVWGLAVSSIGVLKTQGLLVSYAPKDLGAIPAKFRDKADPPYWFGNSAWIAAIVYNTVEGAKLKIPKPETWEDLTKPVYKGQVVMPNPVSSGTGFLDVSAWLQTFGEKQGWDYMTRLHENIARYTHSGSSPATFAGKGEYVVGIAFDVRAARLKEQGAPIEIVFPKAALGWDMNAFAIVKGTKELDAAKKLADWAASPQAMKMYGETRAVVAIPKFMTPIKNLPGDLDQRIMTNDFDWASAHRDAILKEWTRRFDAKSEPKKK
jgi:iron(III) transport system substrate-binding protein